MTHAQHKAALWLEVLTARLKQPGSELTMAEFMRVFSSINPVDARVVVLHSIHGMDLFQIGERLGVSRTSVWRILNRGIQKLGESEDVGRLLDSM